MGTWGRGPAQRKQNLYSFLSARGRFEAAEKLLNAGASPTARTGPPNKTPLQVLYNHGLINYKDTQAKCRHLKN
jgi:hypothetical protein